MLSRVLFISTLLGAIVEAAPAVSLLHQGASSEQEVSLHTSDETDWGGPGKAIWENGGPQNPKIHGHLLTNHELTPIDSIRCLEAKQLDPAVKCDDLGSGVALGANTLGSLNAGNYPSHKDPRCHSNGEYFCDPDSLLGAKDRQTVTDLMTQLRKDHLVTCGPQLQHDPVDKWHYHPFYLGVAIAKDWPLHEADSESLDAFGRILTGRWNMTYLWDGNAPTYARCPTSAMLVILPDQRQAHLSTSSCQFICQEKGGPEVVMSTIMGLDNAGLVEAASAGMRKVYEVVGHNSPMHAQQGWSPTEASSGTWSSWEQKTPVVLRPWVDSTWESAIWNWGQRGLFMIACLLLIASLLTAFVVCYMAPGMAKDLTKSAV